MHRERSGWPYSGGYCSTRYFIHMPKTVRFLGLAMILAVTCNCRSTGLPGNSLVVSVDDQRMVLINGGSALKSYPVSTSKFGLGSTPRSYKTPLGAMYIYQKIGEGMRAGTVFKNRRPTGEVVGPDAPGRDPIVSRILWLEGREQANANTKERLIYIHGTPEERNIGWPTSYGCIRMKSSDIIDLYARVQRGTGVYIKKEPLTQEERPKAERVSRVAVRPRSFLAISRRDEVKAGNVAYAAAHSPAGLKPPIASVSDHEGVFARFLGTAVSGARRFPWRGGRAMVRPVKRQSSGS